jgi:hypothetical protein
MAVPLTALLNDDVARTTADPGATADTTPLALTAATVGDSELHVTVLAAPFTASTSALNDCESPTRSVAVAGVTVTPRTCGGLDGGGVMGSPPLPPQPQNNITPMRA